MFVRFLVSLKRVNWATQYFLPGKRNEIPVHWENARKNILKLLSSPFMHYPSKKLFVGSLKRIQLSDLFSPTNKLYFILSIRLYTILMYGNFDFLLSTFRQGTCLRFTIEIISWLVGWLVGWNFSTLIGNLITESCLYKNQYIRFINK